MKKFLSIALVAVMLVTSILFAGCSKAGVVGKWTCELDMTDIFMESVGGDEMGEYFDFDKFEISLILDLKDDGTYKMSADEEKFEETMNDIIDALKDGMGKYMMEMLEVESLEEVEEALGQSIDSLVEESMGEISVEDLTGEMSSEGNYKYEDGKLYLSESLDTEIDEEIYEVVELDGNTLTFKESVGADDEDQEFADQFYPLVFKK